jgi:hypothetical protein
MRATILRKGPAMLSGVLLLAGLGVTACEPSTTSGVGTMSTPPAEANVGSVSFKLTVAGKYHFNQVTYDLSGNGFHRNATIDVTDSTTFSIVVSGIPFGTGYSLALTANDVAQALTPCQGTATFDVTSPTEVPVAVGMTCQVKLATPPPPPAVPVPRPAIYALGGLLFVLGAARVRRTARS